MLPIQGRSQLVRGKGAASEMMEEADGIEWDTAGLLLFLILFYEVANINKEWTESNVA